MAEAGTEMPIPTATATPVQAKPIATATAVPVQQQRPIATATAVPVAQAGHGSAPTFQRQPTFAARATRTVKQQPLWRKLCCGSVGVLALVLIVFAIVRTFVQGCGCPPGYTDTTSCTDTCSCSCDGNIWGCSYECGGDVCFKDGSEISCATGNAVDNTPSETKSARSRSGSRHSSRSLCVTTAPRRCTACCEPTTCDGDTAPWCNIKNPGCDDEVDGGGWAYCTTDSASSGSVQ